jgi:LacI family transcriptional regulator
VKKRVTILDLAKELNTTAATVSRALQDHPRISFEMKQRVQECAKKFNFKINKIASSLRSGRTFVIGVMIPSAEINFFGSVVHGIESGANLEGYTVLIFQTNELKENEIKGLETFISARVDGILVSLAKETDDFKHFLEIKNKGIPIVFFDRNNDQLGIPSVVIDDFKGAYMATSHLIEQGYKSIAHISGPLHMKIFHDRLMGYKQSLMDHGKPYLKNMVYVGNVSIEAGRAGVRHLIDQKKKPDAFFAVEDFTALGVIKELKSKGISIPQEVGVIGFANEQFDEHITPSLSSIDQQTVIMGKEAFNLILEIIRTHPGEPARAIKNIKLEPIPFFRESSYKKHHD